MEEDDDLLNADDWHLVHPPPPPPPRRRHAVEPDPDDSASATRSDDSTPLSASSALDADALSGSENPSWIDPEQGDLAFPAASAGGFSSDASTELSIGDWQAVMAEGGGGDEAEEGRVEEGKLRKGAAAAAAAGAMPWWRMPLEVVRVWAVGRRPVWVVSAAAAAVIGIAWIGRRIYRMRQQGKGLNKVKVFLDGKKPSQLTARARRLHESFLTLHRAQPKPAASVSSLTPWPVMGHI